jgi:hypothetical protein
MKSKILGCLSAAVLGAAIALPTQALAFRGGSVGGMHGGGGGMHFGGGFGGGGMRFGGGGFGGGGFRGGMVTGRSAFVPAGNRTAPPSPADVFSSTDSTTSIDSTDSTTSLSGITIISATLGSLVNRSLTTMRRPTGITTMRPTGMGAGARNGLVTPGSGSTSATVMATESPRS